MRRVDAKAVWARGLSAVGLAVVLAACGGAGPEASAPAIPSPSPRQESPAVRVAGYCTAVARLVDASARLRTDPEEAELRAAVSSQAKELTKRAQGLAAVLVGADDLVDRINECSEEAARAAALPAAGQ